MEIPPEGQLPTPPSPESAAEREPEPAAEVVLERSGNISDAIAAWEQRCEGAVPENDTIGGTEEMKMAGRRNIATIRDTTKHRVLGDGPGKGAPAVPEGDFYEDLEAQRPAKRTGGGPKEPAQPTEEERPSRPSRTPRTTELPRMGFWESWWKRLDLPSRPQNAFDSVRVAFHENFARKHRQKAEEMARHVKSLEERIGKTKKAVDAGKESAERLWNMEDNLRKMQRKLSNRVQLEDKWRGRRDLAAREFIDRLESATDPTLGDMRQLERRGKENEEQRVHAEQRTLDLRALYQEFAAQRADKRLLSRLDQRITKQNMETLELSKERNEIGKQLRRMNRATSIWTDQHDELRALMRRRSPAQKAPPEETALRPEGTAPPSGAIRSAESAQEEGVEKLSARDLIESWNTFAKDNYVLDKKLEERISTFLQNRERGDTMTKQEFANLLELLKPRWAKKIREYQQYS